MHLIRLAASRTFCTAGSKRPISTAMMAITTSSSISVKPRRERMSGSLIGAGLFQVGCPVLYRKHLQTGGQTSVEGDGHAGGRGAAGRGGFVPGRMRAG